MEIQRLSRIFIDFDAVFVSRRTNCAAHACAKFASCNLQMCSWYLVAPTFLKECLEHDCSPCFKWMKLSELSKKKSEEHWQNESVWIVAPVSLARFWLYPSIVIIGYLFALPPWFGNFWLVFTFFFTKKWPIVGSQNSISSPSMTRGPWRNSGADKACTTHSPVWVPRRTT